MVGVVDLPRGHARLRGDDHVVACDAPGPPYRLVVERGDDARVVAHLALLVHRREGDELGGVAVLGPPRGGEPEGPRLLHLPVYLVGLLPGELGAVRDDPLLGERDGPLAPVLAGHLVLEVARGLLVAPDEVPPVVADVDPPVLGQRPRPLLGRQRLDGPGEHVPVAREDRVRHVVRAVGALVGDPHRAPGDRVSPLELRYDLPGLRLLALVAGEDAHAHGHAVGVEKEPHRHDRLGPVLLGGALPAEAVLAACLEVEVGAVEVGDRRVPGEELGDPVVVYLDDLLVLLAQVGEAVVELVEGEVGLHALHEGQNVVEGPRLRAGRHGPGVDERGEQVGQGEPEPGGYLQVREVGRRPQRVVYGLDREVAQVALGRLGADLGGLGPLLRRLAPGVHRRHLGAEVRHRVRDPGLPELVLVADRPHRPVRRVAAPRVPEALVDLEVEPLLVPGLLEEVRHLRPPVKR